MKTIILVFSMSLMLFSCSENDDISQPQQPEADNFYALKVGNSWVYKNYKYNLNTQNYDNTGVIDSVSIVGTQEFNGYTYFKFRRWTTGNEAGITFCNENGEHFEFFRDSLGYLVKNDGSIKFTNDDYSERIVSQNPPFTLFEKLVNGATQLTVESGSFDCINSERFLRDGSNVQFPGLDIFYYSDGIGLIYDTTSFASQDIPTIIRRLDSYVVQ